MIPTRYLLVLATFLLSLLLYFDRVCISAAKEPLSHDLSLSDKQMGWVLSAFALGYALLQAPTGGLADRFGPRTILTTLVVFWSIFTGLTAGAWNLASLLVIRFLFGAGEAGAFPGMARAAYAWIPMRERGLVQGINFSGGRLGGAFALPVMAWLIGAIGWRASFVLLMGIGFVWAVAWQLWFRNEPAEHPRIDPGELKYILAHRQHQKTAAAQRPVTVGELVGSANVWLLCGQYFCSNFTFYFCLSWLHPHLKARYQLGDVEAGLYAAGPFVAGAVGNWIAGWLVDRIYRAGRWGESRRIPAAIGFLMAAIGVWRCAVAGSAFGSAAWLSVAVLGADMTLAPSWSVCIDIGRTSAGFVSGTMNMAGNIGSFVTGLAFPYLADWTGSDLTYFYSAAALNILAMLIWMRIDPRRPL
jgi:MFS transporter, ACS family, glucarate transporter